LTTAVVTAKLPTAVVTAVWRGPSPSGRIPVRRPFASLAVLLLPVRLWAQVPLAADWVATTDLWGNPSAQHLTLRLDGERLTGDLEGERLEGTLRGGAVRLVSVDGEGGRMEIDGRMEGGEIAGEALLPHGPEPKSRTRHRFTARPVPSRPSGPPQRHELQPSSYANLFSASREPLLRIWPGDTVHTTTLDSGGTDERGAPRALYGNPQTGPIYVEGAFPGDTLVVHLDRLRLTRGYADSLDALATRALGPRLAVKAQDLGRPVRWTLDRERGTASPEGATGALKAYSVPLRPMLGCVALAPGFGWPPASTGDSGRFGGNMDVNEVVEGTTVYLPVEQPGALLYLGDGHAAQGDGELTEWGLETSMEVEVTVDLLSRRRIATPRVESPTHLMAIGQAGSLDDALRVATAGLAQWLEQDYGLTPSEIAQVLGSAVELRIATVVGRNAGVVAKLAKERLAGVPRQSS
jgi:amidase